MTWTKKAWTAATVAAGAVMTTASAALADAASTTTTATAPPSDPDLSRVAGNARLWLLGLLGVAATLMLTVAGCLYMLAGGNPTNVERAKLVFKSAMVGYALAVLAPVLVGVLQGFFR